MDLRKYTAVQEDGWMKSNHTGFPLLMKTG